MTTSLIVIVADRAAHLDHLMAGLARSVRQPDEVVIVDMESRDDPRSVVGRHASGVRVIWVDAARGLDARLPLAAARNAGAARSIGDRLIFCDVDCIPDRDMIGAYEEAIERGGIVCGPVRYLERFWSASLDVERPDIDLDLWARSAPNPVRPPVSIETVDDRHELFWSLAFGLDRETWARIGGFDESYVGYGAEDTDFGFTARALDIPLRWITGGTAYHQWHSGSNPPVENLPALVDNARRFRLRWGRWPMEGWLRALHRRGHVVWNPATNKLRLTSGAPRRRSPLQMVSIPASHPYTRRVVPGDVDVAADPTDPWWPHLALDPKWIESERHGIDLVHLHFGFEHRTPAELESWCDTLDELGIGLVVTVHDLRNPHTPDNGRHHQHLDTLLRRADAVLTLTAGAAAHIEQCWGRRPQVIAHPHVAPLDWQNQFPRRTSGLQPRRVGVQFSSFRPNVLDPEDLLVGLAAGVRDAGATLSVRADCEAPAHDLCRLAAAADRVGAQLLVSDRLGDGALVGALTKLDVIVLPYAFGTHSGMVELCHDLGGRVLIPDVGFYREQWHDVVTFRLDEARRPDPELVRAAIVDALGREPAEPAGRSWREAQLRDVVAQHSMLYADVAGRSRS